jgi:hypothetical protein
MNTTFDVYFFRPCIKPVTHPTSPLTNLTVKLVRGAKKTPKKTILRLVLWAPNL